MGKGIGSYFLVFVSGIESNKYNKYAQVSSPS